MTFRRSGSHPDELISSSLTGELTDEERVELGQHLATCESCRDTLAAFTDERRLVSGLRHVPAPTDLSARVRGGIEAGRLTSVPWWRRPGGIVAFGASLATVAAAALAVVVISNLNPGPVGHTSSPSPSSSLQPSSSGAPSPGPSVVATPEPALALGPGELGYMSLNGAALEASRLTFVNDATGKSISAGTVSGPPIAASLSPTGDWLAYITRKGETGANEVWALHLTDGKVVPLGCSLAAPFTDRLAWGANGRVLGYTLTSVDLGAGSGCPANDGKLGTTEPWLWQAGSNEPPGRGTRVGADSFAADFSGEFVTLAESHAAANPRTVVACWICDSPPQESIDGVFLPLLSPDGNRALFWAGTMASSAGGWQFSRGGMPQLSGDFRSTGPASPWVGAPLFTDLIPVGGEAFASGKFIWGPDSDLIAFWDGAWTGAPQSSDGTYPNQQDVYVGRVSGGLLSAASRLPLILDPNAWIVDVAFSADGTSAAVTIGLPSAGIGDPPSAYLQIVPLAGGASRIIGGGVNPPAWNGLAVFGP